MQPVYLIIGCPGIGKSWICKQLTDRFAYIPHDDFIGREKAKLRSITKAANGDKPVLTETPFSMSELIKSLEKARLTVVPLFVIELDDVIATRYRDREKSPIPPGHLSCQRTYAIRAKKLKTFSGTSNEVLEHLRDVVTVTVLK